ncbi:MULTISPECIES: thiosulfate oxidation carrier protein SoxY [Rhodomicrobium]|uniref:thiosulfate oxidation carrier protein SoxY n=1 Tax=Rhodomicrobium TaxID=1068 RepID=UPI000B4B2999|nr:MULTISPECIES: thiosulfate oxidation carrier protein SoxY [Rhodomicrobium]
MPTRRQIMQAAAALAGAALVRAPEARAATQLEDAIAEKTRGAAVERGRVTLGIPQIAENGLSVFTTVSVESPMTAQDHVKAIHIFSEKNPIAHIASFRLGARAGRAKVSTNIRLAASQRVTAIAEMSDGRFYSDERNVVVTIAACIDGG